MYLNKNNYSNTVCSKIFNRQYTFARLEKLNKNLIFMTWTKCFVSDCFININNFESAVSLTADRAQLSQKSTKTCLASFFRKLEDNDQ